MQWKDQLFRGESSAVFILHILKKKKGNIRGQQRSLGKQWTRLAREPGYFPSSKAIFRGSGKQQQQKSVVFLFLLLNCPGLLQLLVPCLLDSSCEPEKRSETIWPNPFVFPQPEWFHSQMSSAELLRSCFTTRSVPGQHQVRLRFQLLEPCNQKRKRIHYWQESESSWSPREWYRSCAVRG